MIFSGTTVKYNLVVILDKKKFDHRLTNQNPIELRHKEKQQVFT